MPRRGCCYWRKADPLDSFGGQVIDFDNPDVDDEGEELVDNNNNNSTNTNRSTKSKSKKPQIDANGNHLDANGNILPIREHHNWQYLLRIKPFLWPKGKRCIQFLVVASVMLLILSRASNLISPIAYKSAINSLTTDSQHLHLAPIILYGVSLLLNTVFTNLRDTVFLRVSQNAINEAATAVFDHLLRLSIDFHIQRRTGKIFRALDRGSNSINNLVTMLLFNIVPTMIEILIVCTIFVANYVIWFSIITLITVVLYTAFTIRLTELRNKYRRSMNDKDHEARDKAVDALINYENVKCFVNEKYESVRFSTAMEEFMMASQKAEMLMSLLNVGQAAIIAAGQLSIMALAAIEVHLGKMTVGDFVLVNTYLLQLYAPLGLLGNSYRTIKMSLVDLETMFELLDEEPHVKDAPDATPLCVTNGEIVFENVKFSYDNHVPVLKGISFRVPPGHTVAIVGPSGAGKSSMSKLLFRFYDPTEGRILIDGQDIAKVTQDSLRAKIGIVPQDTVLFNESIEYNIGYGKPGLAASHDEIRRVAKLCCIDDFIQRLPDGYQTRVGERGLRLSGGEKQRVSIARVLLKDPPIMMFDEATSSLDTHTEQEIMESLRMCSKGRTSLIIAHRLSTIVHADEILVLKGGYIVERGTHAELMQKDDHDETGAVYKKMWLKQQQALKNAVSAAADVGSDYSNSNSNNSNDDDEDSVVEQQQQRRRRQDANIIGDIGAGGKNNVAADNASIVDSTQQPRGSGGGSGGGGLSSSEAALYTAPPSTEASYFDDIILDADDEQ